MKDFVIDGITIKPGEETLINLNIAKLPSRTPIDLPIYVNRSVHEGPTVLLLAGMHGDEINGMEILRKVLANGLNNPAIGSIITIPVLNIYGFLNFSRALPDGKDINRSFPGSAMGSLASRVAYEFVKEILPIIDLGVDMHTGGDSRTNYPQIRCDFSKERALELAKAFHAPFMIDAPLRPKSLRSYASKKNIPFIVYEGGEALRFDNHAINEGYKGIQRVLNHLGMVSMDKEVLEPSKVISKMSWIRAQAAGLFHAQVKYGDRVQRRQVIGTITDAYGSYIKNVKSPSDGYAIGLNQIAVVNQGDALFNIGS